MVRIVSMRSQRVSVVSVPTVELSRSRVSRKCRQAALPSLCTYQRPSTRGGGGGREEGDLGDIRGNSAGFADFFRQYLARERGIGPLLHFRGKIHGERPAGLGVLYSKHRPN